MAGLIYFKPGYISPSLPLSVVHSWGLGYAFDSEPDPRRCVHPTAGEGSVFAPAGAVGELTLGMYPEEQTWSEKSVIGSDCLVGYYNDSVPTPADLVREDQSLVAGYLLELSDGNTWHVPRVVHLDEGQPKSNLPCRLDVDDEGKICQGDPIKKYQYLWGLVEPYIKTFLVPSESDEYELASDDVLGDAVKLLQVNYRIGMRESILLGMFSTDTVSFLKVCLCSIEYRTWLEWQDNLKKTNGLAESAGSSSADGKKDSPQDIAQPQLTS